MKKILLSFFICTLALTMQMSATIHIVNQQGLTFSPADFTVTVGDTVRFQWNNGSHNTVSTDVPAGASSWNSPLNSGNQSYDYEVAVAGSYAYVCTFHAGQDGIFTAEAAPNTVQNVQRAAIEMNVRTSANGNLTVHVLNASGDKAIVTMLDITGREVATIHQGVIASDDYTIRQDVSAFQRGIYFVRFQQGARVSTRKILVQ
jgi:plastocyanin